MLPHKSTVNLGELQKYFSSTDKAIHTLFTELRSLKINEQCKSGKTKR